MITPAARTQLTTPRKRRRHVRGQMALRGRDKNGQHRGGARPGAGRKPKPGRRPTPHRRRPEINPRHPQHVVLRVLGRVGWLRRMDMYQAIRSALVTAVVRSDFRICHYSVQGDHIHLICEANDRDAFSSGVRGFAISAARQLNATLRRKGQVFATRYYARALPSPRQVRNCLAYVMNNWRHHHRDRKERGIFGGRLDPYSSAMFFPGWRERTHPVLHVPRGTPLPVVSRAQTWLLGQSWKQAPPLSVYYCPKDRP